ncbi:MAG: penicillin-insensitive murein endopeptidase [Paracoccaceae bacterium]
MFARLIIFMSLIAGLVSAPAQAEAEAVKYKFGAKGSPAAMAPAAHGEYAKGCLAGGVELPETGPSWQAMRLSRNRNWGHPDAIAFIKRFSSKVQTIGWPRLYVGDISQPRGGPMRSGHRSHQLGLDIDIWLRRPSEGLLSRQQREKIGSPRVVSGGEVNSSWTPSHHQVLKAAASDPGVARIFVNPVIKRAMCWAEPVGDRMWLRKIRPWYGHDAHFHVRLNCPGGSAGCVPQAVIPPGDGCGDALSWWFEPKKPDPDAPKPKKRRELVLSDLPRVCAGVLTQ